MNAADAVDRLRGRGRQCATTGLLMVLVLAAVLVAPTLGAETTSGHWETPGPVVVLGLITGLTYGLLAVGLVLVYRTSRIINFAHGEIGAFAAAVLGIAVVKWGLPYWVAFPVVLVIAAGIGAIAEIAVVRRLAKAPLIMSVVATLGLGQFLVMFSSAINQEASAGSLYPRPPGFPEFQVGAFTVTQAHTATLVVAPIVVLALAIFLKRTRFGLALRSTSANPEAARLSGIFAGRMSALAWGLAGTLAAFTAIMMQPTRGFSSAEAFGPNLLLRALACAVVARMTSLPAALAAGAALGVVEQLVLWNYPTGGFVELVLFLVILVALLLQRKQTGRSADKGSWAAVVPMAPLSEKLREAWLVRHLGALTGVVVLVLAALAPLVMDNSTAVTMTGIFAFGMVALSVGLVTGLSGALSLGQFAVAAVGALASIKVASMTGNFPLAFLCAGLAAAAMSLVIGLPALRVNGLLLTVTTLAFALASSAWLFRQDWTFGAGVEPGRPVIGGVALTTGKQYYYVALVLLVVAVVFVRNVRRGGTRRLLVAVRDHEDAARAFTVRAQRTKVRGFLLAGFVAGLGGATYAHAFSSVSASTFPTSSSISVVQMAVVGGLGMLAGPLVGALFIQGLPAAVPLDAAGLAASSFGLLLLVLYVPQGLVALVQPVRDALARRLAAWSGVRADDSVDAHGEQGSAEPPKDTERQVWVPSMRVPPVPEGGVPGPLLEADGLSRSFGGVQAVRDVSLLLHPGETLGLIGPNGAGKTTTFELLAGFTRPDHGTVRLHGRDITRLGPEARAEHGLVRSFQDAALFPTLTVLETVQTALERVSPTRMLPELVGLHRQERRKEQEARGLLAFMGLDRYRRTPIRDLSTGTRRLVELSCLIAMQPTVLLLDEPTSGVAQRETEALGELLQRLRATFGMSLIIIEHDIPMVMALSDRVVAMAEGRVIRTGTPEQVRTDPQVVDAYLGGSEIAIHRSGARQ